MTLHFFVCTTEIMIFTCKFLAKVNYTKVFKCELSFKIYLLYLKELQREKGWGRERGIFQLLIHSLNVSKELGLLKPEARSFVRLPHAGAWGFESSSTIYTDHKKGDGLEVKQTHMRLERMPTWDAGPIGRGSTSPHLS